MTLKKTSLISLAIFLFGNIAVADVAPDPGYRRVSLNLVIETKEDISDYRFFLQSQARDIEEINLNKGETTNISAEGRGGRFRYVNLIAVPNRSLKDFGENISPEKLKNLSDLLNEKKIEGAANLTAHNFQPVVKDTDQSWNTLKYTIERDENGIKAVKIGGSVDSANSNAFSNQSEASKKTTIVFPALLSGY